MLKIQNIELSSIQCLYFFKGIVLKSIVYNYILRKNIVGSMVQVLSHKTPPVGECFMRVRVQYKHQYFCAVCNL